MDLTVPAGGVSELELGAAVVEEGIGRAEARRD